MSICLIPFLPSESLFVISDDITFFIIRGVIFDSTIIFQIVILAWLTRRGLKKYGKGKSEKTVRRQKQFLRALNIQLLIPFISLIIPLFYIFMEYQLSFYIQKYNNIGFIIFASHGLLSSVVMLGVHSPYREFIFQVFRNFGYLLGIRACVGRGDVTSNYCFISSKPQQMSKGSTSNFEVSITHGESINIDRRLQSITCGLGFLNSI
ncbi:hypothetical protein CRE_19861 [Caenorhabditis remanei]|uniref:Uncharacterized protein n=1 Tax=Caenorhabditis remanei TaxID=31234 RepID=E3MTC4_CAERE|nr:hypothetical protein CRE_19861 [Caenorhabditis remanei]